MSIQKEVMKREYGYLQGTSQKTTITQKKGQYVSGYSVGILYLEDCWYPVLPGNVANLSTYAFPVRLKKVPNCTTSRILNGDPTLKDSIIQAAKELEAEGARAISAACGFFGNFQKEVAAAVDIPVYLSSVVQVPWIATGLKPNQKIGVLTAYAKGITSDFLKNCGIRDLNAVVIKDLSEYQEFSAIIQDRGTFDHEGVRHEALHAAKELVNQDGDIAAILLECSDLPPYAATIQSEIGLPVFDFITMINWIHHSTSQKPYDGFI